MGNMFRITEQRAGDRLVLRLEGRCSGPWVGELDACWRIAADARTRGPILVDLTDVYLVDPAGREQLARMHRGGAQFVTRGCAMRELVREIASSGPSPVASFQPGAEMPPLPAMSGRSEGLAFDEPGDGPVVTKREA